MMKPCFACLVFLCITEYAHGECPPSDSLAASVISDDSVNATASGMVSPLKWYDMFANIPEDWESFASTTFRKETIPVAISLGAVTAALMVADHDSWTATEEAFRRSDGLRDTKDVLVTIGDGATQIGVAGAFALYGFAAGDRRALRTASQVTEVILATGAVVQLLKHVTGRERPERATRKGGKWQYFPNQVEYHKHVPNYDAFPSGHIATTMATLTVIAQNYPEVKWLKPASFIISGLVGMGLVARGMHWYSDFPVGLAIGYEFGMIASHPEGSHLTGEVDGRSLTIMPVAEPDGGTVVVAYRF